jgi:hypothetical protein
VHFKHHRLARQRVVEVELHGLASFALFDLLHRARILARTIGRRELHHITHLVLLVRVAQFIEQLARHPLHQLRVALAKGLTGWQLKGGACALGQADQPLLNGRRELARAQAQRGGLATEGVDDVRARFAVDGRPAMR